MQPDRPQAPDGPVPDGTPDGRGLTDRQRQAFGSLGDRLARLPAGHPSAPGYHAAAQERKKLLNETPVADGPSSGGAAPGTDGRGARGERGGAAGGGLADGGAALVPGARDRHASVADGLGGRLARTVAAGEAARAGRAYGVGRSAGGGAADRGSPGGQGADGHAGWPVGPGTAGRREAYRPWFYGSGEPWFSADWTGAGAGWSDAATRGRSS
jgi:hypothetical protein